MIIIKERSFSAYHDFNTGIFCKISIFFGIILLIFYVFIKISANFFNNDSNGLTQNIYNFSQSAQADSIIAFSVLLLAVGVILYFFHCQFGKLAKIAEEIENNEDLEE